MKPRPPIVDPGHDGRWLDPAALNRAAAAGPDGVRRRADEGRLRAGSSAGCRAATPRG